MNNIPNEIIVTTLEFLSPFELRKFIPPNHCFQSCKETALQKLSDFKLGMEIEKKLSDEHTILQVPTTYGSLLPDLIAKVAITKITLTDDEQNEGIPNPDINRFTEEPIITGVTKLNRRFLSILLVSKGTKPFVWTTYQIWEGANQGYWKVPRGKVVSKKDSAFVTENAMNRLAKILLGTDPDYTICYKVPENFQEPLSHLDAHRDQDLIDLK